MNKLKIDKRKLNSIKKQLQKGDLSEIARNLGLSRMAVYKSMSGESMNLKVIDLAIKKAKQNQSIYKQICTNPFKRVIKST